jgi:hypothetical protein
MPISFITSWGQGLMVAYTHQHFVNKKPAEAAFAACGWKSDSGDEEILETYLSLKLERAKS